MPDTNQHGSRPRGARLPQTRMAARHDQPANGTCGRHGRLLDGTIGARALIACCATVILADARPAFADAAELCVACEGPTAVYRCQIEGQPSTDQGGAQFLCIRDIAQRGGHASCAASRRGSADCANARPWLIARDAAGQDLTATTGDGAIVPRLSPGSPDARPEPSPLQRAPATSPEATAAPPLSPPSGAAQAPSYYVPPRSTVARGTAADTTARGQAQDQLPGNTGAQTGNAEPSSIAPARAAGTGAPSPSEAGGAIGGAAKKTWDCLTSLFSKC